VNAYTKQARKRLFAPARRLTALTKFVISFATFLIVESNFLSLHNSQSCCYIRLENVMGAAALTKTIGRHLSSWDLLGM